ncbi:MAG: AAA family ATPase [Acetobacteraceae bacterium]
MLSVRFESFRGFQDTNWVELRPITLLIGENSAGKTSFLAGVRYLLEAFGGETTAPFNRSPYFLGGFEQIAHVRGGRGGRAKSFNLSLKAPGRDAETAQTSLLEEPITYLTHKFTFAKGYPQPEIETYSLSDDRLTFNVSFAHEVPRGNISKVGALETSVAVPFNRSPPSSLIKANSSYITILLEELRFAASRSGSTKQRDEEIEPVNLEALGVTSGHMREFLQYARVGYGPLSRHVYATAPVRTQPLRTYTPSELIASSEGSDVPLELARAKLRSPAQWQAVKKRLVEFGLQSGLFTDIDVKQFGKNDIDPFQLMVKVDGPAMNMVDVGYGISQILPIIYQVQNATSRYSTFLLQQPEVHLHPRAQAALGSLFAQAIKRPKSRPLFVIETHSDYIIDRLRIEIAEKKIESKDVTIIFFERTQHGTEVSNLFVDANGEIQNPPPNFRGFFLDEHARLLGLD